MARETKTQVWNNVQKQVNELIETSKVSKKFSEELLNILEASIAPKSGGSGLLHPPKEIDGVLNYYCRFHETYYTEDKMVMSVGKSKGYCKAAISLWNKTNSNIKKLESSVSDLVEAGDFEEAQVIAKEAKELKSVFNTPAFYDADRDWNKFNNVVPTEV